MTARSVFTALAVAALAAAGVDAQCRTQKLLAYDGAAGDWYGYSAAVSSGVAVVGARWDDDLGTDSGAAYVYAQVSGVWTTAAKLVASDGASLDGYGRSVAISNGTVLVSARYDDDLGPNSGSGYFYEQVAGVWTEVQKVTASDGSQGSWFGHHVDMNGDLAIFGAPDHDGIGVNSGAAYVFERPGPGQPFTEVAKLLPGDPAASDQFGYAVAIDGNTAAVAAWGDDDVATNSGSVYVFERLGPGQPWVQTGKLQHAFVQSEDRFGSMISLSGDTLMVGAIGADERVGASVVPDTGVAWFFERTMPSKPFLQWQRLVADVPTNRDFFGFYVDIDGDRAVVGAWGDDDLGSDSGSTYIYERSGAGQTWGVKPKLTLPEGDVLDEFGVCVSISGDLVLATAGFDDDRGVDSGSAVLFSATGTQCATLTATPYELSVAVGGVQTMTVSAGASFAGDGYWLLGSFSGTWPGIPWGPWLVPLNFDPYLLATVVNPNGGVFTNNQGLLDGAGAAAVPLSLPAGADPALAGLSLDHSCVLYDPLTAALKHVTNSVRLLLSP